NKPNVAGKGPIWLFDLDYLTDSMNYHPIRSENQANLHAVQQEANQNACTEDITDVGDSEKEDESAQDCFVLPIWPSYSSTITPALKTDDKREAMGSTYQMLAYQMLAYQMLDYGFNFMNTKIYIDNESTICIVKNPVYHSKTKHIAIRHHFIRDAYEKKLIQVLKIHTDNNVADLLTKAFDVSRFQFLVVTIGMINP
ncbi:hypothetical protein Tco_1295236, partial [Tanacetum coccineum]